MNSNSASESQQRLLDFLKDLGQSNLSVPKEIAEILNISLESAYRRLRGEVEFTFGEVVRIADRFSISLDVIMGQKTGTFATVHYNKMYNENSVFVNYLGNVNDRLEKVREKDGSVLYICNTLPITTGFRGRPLREFKIFYWQRVVLNRDRLKGIRFSENFELTDPVNYSVDVLLDHYDHVNGKEIWNEGTIDSTIRQVEYCKRLGLFENDKALEAVYNSLNDSLNDLEFKLASADKDKGYQFYVCSIELASNCVQMQLDERFYTYLNFSIFNSVTTTNIGLGEEVELWYRCLLNKSTQIAGESDLIRHKFFNDMREKLNKLS